MSLQIPGYNDFLQIHQGRQYTVFRVREERTGTPRIIKAVQPGPYAAHATAMLRHEHEMLSGLEVPGVVRPLSLEEVAGILALVLEDAGPVDLEQHLGQKPLETGLFLELAIQVTGIVLELHQRNVIHRDINPSNLVVRPDSRQVTLIDFCTATKATGLVGASEGTLAYIAPEQTGRMNRLVDHRADLYALGATLYEMLTGVPPFVSADPVELIHAHLARSPVPPEQLNPSIAKVLSDIVLKLLAKMPEERYQSAEALELDLRAAWRSWKERGVIAPFALAWHDRARELVISDKLYGLKHELAELCCALKRVNTGPSEVVLITGDAGSGKSSLVHELRRRLEGRARFLFGKFDPLHGHVPHAPLVEALGGLVRGLLQEPPDALLPWRQRLREALGSHAGIMSRFIPELARLLGEPPRPEPLGGTVMEGRFQLAFQAFLQVFATRDCPLVLFMDDLQWADTGSLQLLQSLATAPDLHHVLLLGAYRSKEVGPDHRLLQTLGVMHAAGAALRTLEVPPLDRHALIRLCRDTLHTTPHQVEPLAELLLRKTAGNPFFIKRLLRYLHQCGLLVFDAEQERWSWDLERIAQVEVTENVIELMLPAIRRLPELTQRLLEMASCFRGRVDLWLLSAVAGRSVEDAAGALWSAIQEGLLVPASQGPRFASGERQVSESPAAQTATYCFVHDRIRQEVYSLLPEDERRRIHREVGHRLLEGVSEQELDERIFEVVDHFDMGLESSRGLGFAERLRLAELYYRAGSRAVATSAFNSALVYLRHGLELLPWEAWRSHHELALLLHRQAAECAHLTGAHALAEALIQDALPHVTLDLEKVDLYEIHVIAYIISRNYQGAIQWGREGLRLMGQELPARELERAVAAESAAVDGLLAGHTREELLAAPSMQDPRLLALMRFMSSVVMAAWFSDQLLLFSYFQVRMLHFSLEHGHSPYSAHAYASYAMILGVATGDYDTAMKLGETGVELSRRYADPRQECRCLLMFAAGVNHWRAPYRTSIPLSRRAITAGLEGNEFLFAGYAATNLAVLLYSMGTELSRAHAECEASLVLLQKLGHRDMKGLLLAYRQAIRCLQERTHQRARYDDDAFSEKEYVDSIRESPLVLCEYQALRVQTSYLLGDLADALEMSRAAGTNVHFMRPFVNGIDYVFYTALTLAAYQPAAPSSEKDSLLAQLEAHLHSLDTWARGCPENFRQKHQLVAAELAQLEGRQSEAMRLYDAAIGSAHQNEFPQDEALANDLAGRYYHSLGHHRIAALYLRAAVKGFARWGAKAKASILVEEFPELTLGEALPWKTPTTRDDEESRGARLDLLSILKAAETLSGEVVLDRLLEKLMTVCLEVAGAQCGALLLHEEGSLYVRARGSTSEPVTLERAPFHSSSYVPPTMVAHAYESGDAVILADARRSSFSSDPYVVSHALKSALAVPIRRQASCSGVLYLENNLATRAFAPDRVRVLQLLSSQMAISLENSLLFGKLHVEIEERRRAERAVRFLAESSVVLAESLLYETTLTRVARLAVPFLADCCMVLVLERPHTLHCVAVACASPAKEALLRESQRRHPPQWDSGLPGVVAVRTGEPQVIPEVSDELLRVFSQDEHYLEVMRSFDIRSVMAVPLIAQDKSIGSISLFCVTPKCRYGPADLALAQELARRAAISIDNARLYREAQEAIRLRDEFLSIASHELYTPITSLKLSMQGLERASSSARPDVISRAFQNARLQIRRLTRLIDELLSVSRLQAGQVHLQLEDVDLVAITRDVVEHFREESVRSGSSVLIRADTPVMGRWDRGRLEQVITNLLANAIKFGNHKPVELSITADNGIARLSVQDHGIGIAPDRLPHVFERFVRAVSVREYGGLGLGLYIAHEIVSALGGAIHVDSTPGVGTCFTVLLPRFEPPISGVSIHQAAGHA
ncbi:ATP-binding sensor histidine kinase [Archangium lansingense]|uniref:histidine kinase n=1 Tax=Archangium lansingense TaxID=2995310 RepID=A0ABT4ADV9_9BACT|nr:ATP-binding sensor histidine kinase [Archangium lansinium]MCY1079845.1 trifunctional serine/threonine-protein kinase/ATP-binding protein/sensor histidine kinase [Archangium lansinium]